MQPAILRLVFSKDRPAQLDLLLRSLALYDRQLPGKYAVLYATSSYEYRQGYQELKKKFPWVSFTEQTHLSDFKWQLLEILRNGHLPMVMPLVDDAVMVFPFRNQLFVMEAMANPRCEAVSLRLGLTITYCYPTDRHVLVPDVAETGYVDWNNHQGDWGYPMSLDGNIYRYNRFVQLCERLQYSTPNQLEVAMACDGTALPTLAVLRRSRLVAIPNNRVQQEFPNRNFGNDPFVINQRFLNGEQIKFEPFQGMIPTACHVPMAFEYEPKPQTNLEIRSAG